MTLALRQACPPPLWPRLPSSFSQPVFFLCQPNSFLHVYLTDSRVPFIRPIPPVWFSPRPARLICVHPPLYLSLPVGPHSQASLLCLDQTEPCATASTRLPHAPAPPCPGALCPCRSADPLLPSAATHLKLLSPLSSPLSPETAPQTSSHVQVAINGRLFLPLPPAPPTSRPASCSVSTVSLALPTPFQCFVGHSSPIVTGGHYGH
jgi:hypothetical protein